MCLQTILKIDFTLTEWLNLWLNGSLNLWNQKWLFYGIAVKNLLSTFIFKSVPSQIVPYSTVLTRTAWWK